MERAARREPDAWRADPHGALALVILLDQFPRNLFRDDSRAFATDAHARHVARDVIARGCDRALDSVQRMFLYLPFEHSELLADQDEALRLLATIEDTSMRDSALEWARKHREIIARFGRFPHRNAMLGRDTTPEDRAFLAEPGSSF